MYIHDSRTVVTLDAGGTNPVFGAMKGCEYITEPITYPSNAHDLDLCLDTMVSGFREVIDSLDEKPVAISFAFPGPADYPNGIIGGFLPNFPSFREGVALGPFLRKMNSAFRCSSTMMATCLPTARRYAELCLISTAALRKPEAASATAICWAIPSAPVSELEWWSTGSLTGAITPAWRLLSAPQDQKWYHSRGGVAVRAVKRVYAELSGDLGHSFEPKDICEIADGKRPGDVAAARRAFEEFGETAGDAMAIAAQLIDGIIVIGGGITAARHLILPSLLGELRASLSTIGGDSVRRVQMEVFNLDDQAEFEVLQEETAAVSLSEAQTGRLSMTI